MTTKEKILLAAREEFFENGFAATRMRAIADRAEINKGLLHYYFKTKDALIVEIFEKTFSALFGSLETIFNSEKSLSQKISLGVSHYMDFMLTQPKLPMFIIREMERDAENHLARLKKAQVRPPFQLLARLIESGKKNGTVDKDINTQHFIINMISMMLFPILGSKMMQFVHGMNEAQYENLLIERKEIVAQNLIKLLEPKQSI